MNDQPKKDVRPEGGVLLEALMMGGVAYAQHIAIHAQQHGYTGGLTSSTTKGINYYSIKLEEKNGTTTHP